MFATIGKFVYHRRWLVLIAGLLFVIASGVYGTSVFGSLKNGGFYDQGAEFTKVADQIHQQLGRDEQSLIVLFTSRDSLTVESPAIQAGSPIYPLQTPGQTRSRERLNLLRHRFLFPRL